jgi:hypothetical protein
MQSSDFNPGDHVRLVSDRTEMTVHKIDETGVWVVYMHDGKIVHDVVPPAALVKVVQAPRGPTVRYASTRKGL